MTREFVEPLPRVNASMLEQRRGKLVAIVGKVSAIDGNMLTITAADGNSVSIQLSNHFEEIVKNQIYEFFGNVIDDSTVESSDVVPYSDNFDLQQYNRMITLAHSEAFAPIFHY